jgi:ADP-dependent NAD(P)H-hydrate dehydratase / NAD(P)H-hydrate epimerase
MPIPVITVAQMREWERVTWASGVKEDEVMRRAGRAVARLVERYTKPGDRVLVLAGKGHNGDDAAYAHDSIEGRKRELLRVIDPEVDSTEVVGSLEANPALIVDGLFGVGLNRPLATSWMKLIQRINEFGSPILSVDVPSGLSADSGLPLELAIRATWTLTLGAVKQGLLKASAAPFTGRLEVAEEIGLLPYPFQTEVSLCKESDFNRFPPRRLIAGHKGTFGHVVLIGGTRGYHGAAVLAARGAQRAQPGLVTLFTDEPVYLPIASQLQSVMVSTFSPDFVLPESCTSVVIGPGLAAPANIEGTQRIVHHLWRDFPLPVIADASALNWLRAGPCKTDAARVMTPHPGEAARLLETTVGDVQRDRVSAVRELSRRYGNCLVVLKGYQTVIGRNKEDVRINNSGNPHLAQGGAGDILAGYIGGFLAHPELQSRIDEAVRYAVWHHGSTADWLLAGGQRFSMEELVQALGQAMPTTGHRPAYPEAG